jgi:hypothetical protein
MEELRSQRIEEREALMERPRREMTDKEMEQETEI